MYGVRQDVDPGQRFQPEALPETGLQENGDVGAILQQWRFHPIPPNAEPADVSWGIVYHRIQRAKDGEPDCQCASCRPYLREIRAKYWEGAKQIGAAAGSEGKGQMNDSSF
jgi:hypothetical protein